MKEWGSRMTREDEIREILYAYEQAGLIEGDPIKVLSFLSEDVIGIGMGDQGFVSSKEDVSRIMMETIKKDTSATYALEYDNIEIQFACETCANLCAKVIVLRTADGVTMTSSFMQSLNLTRSGQAWRICQLHASSLMLSDESINTFPLSIADKTLAYRRSLITTDAFELMSASFAGGVVGVHQVGDKYPLYFANDGIARFLGYTEEEFRETFAEDVSQIFYAGDYEYVMRLTENVLLRNEDCRERLRLQKKDGSLLPVIDYARRSKDNEGNDILIAVFTDISELVDLHQQLEEQNQTILSSLRYASKIQLDLLPANRSFAQAFSDSSVLRKPRDIVGGDMYWMQSFDIGTVLAVCDCTGHGTPGALLTMLVASTLDNVVNKRNCRDTAQLILLLDQRISTLLNVHTADMETSESIIHICDGCDLAILFIAKDGSVTISTAGIPVFICDGSAVQKCRGQLLHVGEGLLKDPKEIKSIEIPASEKNKFYIATDGLYDQIGGAMSMPFGYRIFKDIICRNHHETQAVISERLWEAFEQHRGKEHRRDDVQLISFKP